jgi:hypothetical protein
VARQYGITHIWRDPGVPVELFAKDEASGTMNGMPVSVYVFRTTEAKDNWVKAANEFGGFDTVKDGPLFLVVKGP